MPLVTLKVGPSDFGPLGTRNVETTLIHSRVYSVDLII